MAKDAKGVETDPVKIAAARAKLDAEAPALSRAAWEFVRTGRRPIAGNSSL